ncbi:hypothetical protein GIB67_010733, partial [Kingdonia uniflora]
RSSLLAASYPSQTFEGYLKAHLFHKQAFQEITKMMLRRRSLDSKHTLKTNSTSASKALAPHQHQKY